ncbi:unnamed protein product [Adineta ricciae]|uniref:Uncharacterized protein n=1 Tax=Adineta ricciae TaxID=249248 RepID=A0A814A4T2_ADIRI|nr:unnamed protein product [Adineta ricciae]CAF0907940.1 unnamed protein product [Adineta ricciae]
MADEASQNIEQEEQNATKAAADENARELRKENSEHSDSDDEVVKHTSKLPDLTSSSSGKTKREQPEMNIQLQR